MSGIPPMAESDVAVSQRPDSAGEIHRAIFPWHVTWMPAVATIGVVVMRWFLHHGDWRAWPTYAAALVMCALGAMVSAAVAADGATTLQRVAGFLGWFALQVAAASGAIATLWWLLPLRFVGP